MIREKIMRAQKARSDWIVQGDKNTKYIQTVVKQRRAQSRILHLKTVDGNTIEDLKVIESTLMEHFRNQYVEVETKPIQTLLEELATLHIPKIDQHQQSYLDSPITDVEIEKAVYQLGPYKALGPDGIPTFFYEEYWSIVKQDTLNSVHAFFHSSSLLKSLNQTFLTLIPKVNIPEDVSQFRPIAFAMSPTKSFPKFWCLD